MYYDFYFYIISIILVSVVLNLWLIFWIVREVEFVYNGLCSYMKFKLFNFVNLILMIGRIIWGGDKFKINIFF